MGEREKCVRVGLVSLGVAAVAWSFTAQHQISAAGQTTDARDQLRQQTFTAATAADPEGPPLRLLSVQSLTEALAAYDNKTNGFTDQGTFNANKDTFEEVEQIADGLGPTYNAQSCRECHQNVVTGGASQVT